jgi:hypothetical protein
MPETTRSARSARDAAVPVVRGSGPNASSRPGAPGSPGTQPLAPPPPPPGALAFRLAVKGRPDEAREVCLAPGEGLEPHIWEYLRSLKVERDGFTLYDETRGRRVDPSWTCEQARIAPGDLLLIGEQSDFPDPLHEYRGALEAIRRDGVWPIAEETGLGLIALRERLAVAPAEHATLAREAGHPPDDAQVLLDWKPRLERLRDEYGTYLGLLLRPGAVSESVVKKLADLRTELSMTPEEHMAHAARLGVDEGLAARLLEGTAPVPRVHQEYLGALVTARDAAFAPDALNRLKDLVVRHGLARDTHRRLAAQAGIAPELADACFEDQAGTPVGRGFYVREILAAVAAPRVTEQAMARLEEMRKRYGVKKGEQMKLCRDWGVADHAAESLWDLRAPETGLSPRRLVAALALVPLLALLVPDVRSSLAGRGTRVLQAIGLASEYDDDGFDRQGLDRAGYGRDGFNPQGYDRRGFDRQGLNREGYDRGGFDRQGFDRQGLDRDGRNRQGRDPKGFDKDGFGPDDRDKYGFDRRGFDRDDYGRDGFNEAGVDRKGWNRAGFGPDGFDRQGYNAEGYDRKGFHRETRRDREGYDKEGFDPAGYDRSGFNREGYDRQGFDRQGYDHEGYSRRGCDRGGRDRQGNPCEDRGASPAPGTPAGAATPSGPGGRPAAAVGAAAPAALRAPADTAPGPAPGTAYARDGYDASGYDRLGFDRTGFDRSGRDRKGYDRDGFDVRGLDKAGYDRNGFDARGSDRDGFGRDGRNRDGFDRRGRDVNGLDREGRDDAGTDLLPGRLASLADESRGFMLRVGGPPGTVYRAGDRVGAVTLERITGNVVVFRYRGRTYQRKIEK